VRGSHGQGVVEEKRGSYHTARRFYLRALEMGEEPVVVSNLRRVELALQGVAGGQI
jgi:hypothetical protein